MAAVEAQRNQNILDLAINCYTQEEDFNLWMKWIDFLDGNVVDDTAIKMANIAFTSKMVGILLDSEEYEHNINHIPLDIREIIVAYVVPPPMEFIVWNWEDHQDPPMWMSIFWYMVP